MVEYQIRRRGISNYAILKAMKKVPRHLFVPEEKKSHSYEDRPLSIGHGQTISQPYIVAFMTAAITPDKEDKVLEIGTGSGYQAAVLAEIVKEVYTIEIVPALAAQARHRLEELGYDNVHVFTGDGYAGWPDKAPFDAIIVTAAPEEIPPPLLEQLKDGGKMIIPVGPKSYIQSLKLITRKENNFKEKDLIPVRFVPFTGEGVEE